MIALSGLQFQYPQGFQLWIERLEIAPGAQVAVVGPSGSGKTTLLYLIAGILLPNAGSVRVGEVDVNRLNDAARRDFRIRQIGLVFQEFELLDYLNVRENILLPFRINRTLSLTADVRQRVRRIAEAVGLGPLLERPVAKLSQGERQRVAICRALVTQPQLLLADEPTGNLDPRNSLGIVQLLQAEARARHATFVMVTHDHTLLEHFDRVVDFADFLAPQHVPSTSENAP